MRKVSIIEFVHNKIFLDTLGQSRRGARAFGQWWNISCWRYSPLPLCLRGEHWGKRQLCLVLLFLEKKATPQKEGERSLPALLLVGKVKLSGMSLDGHLLDPFSLICFCLSNRVRNLQACLPLVSFFFSFPSRGGRTVCLLFEGRNNDLSIFSPCSSPVLREAWPFPAKAFYFHRCIAQEREVWLYQFGGCLFFLSFNIWIIGEERGL